MRDDDGVGGSDDPAREGPPSDGPDAEDRPAQSESQGDSAEGADGGTGGDHAPPPGVTSQPADGGAAGSAASARPGHDAGREHPDGPQGAPAENTDGPGWLLYAYDLVSSVAVVVLIGGLLFAASGVWPPMVAVESGSMEPVMEKGDLVYVMEADRFPGEGAHGETGVVTAERGRETGYQQFGGHGDVIVYQPDGREGRTPIIHRAMLWVEDGERWADRANPAYLGGADSCSDLPDDVCPAPNAGFITKGDANGGYDQVTGIVNAPVKPEWVIGTAELHVPYLGEIRLGSSGLGAAGNGTGSTVQALNGTGSAVQVPNATALGSSPSARLAP